ncbi:hypothetical protein PMAYCL1PPCAC_32775, partial [Pristionchus mayeri]
VSQAPDIFNFKNIRKSASRAILIITYNVPSFLFIRTYRNYQGGLEFARIHYPSLHYFFEDLRYHAFAYDPTLFPEYTIIVALSFIFLMIFAAIGNSYFVLGSFYWLSRLSASMSEKTRILQRKTVILLMYLTYF